MNILSNDNKQLPDRSRYPNYLVEMFGFIKGPPYNEKFTGYHTKAFKEKMRSHTSADDSKWFEGMERLWTIKKIPFEKLSDIKKKAYNAMMQNIKIDYTGYNRIQIKFLFDGNWQNEI